MKLIMIAAMSADGFIAERGDQSSLDWTSPEDLKFFVMKTKEIGTMVMGRKTFETIGKPLKGRLMVVMTSDPSKYAAQEQPGVVEFTDEEPEAVLAALGKRGIDTVALTGGAGIYGAFLRAGLVDELYLTVEPILFGDGVKLADTCDRIDMRLLDSVRLGDQAVLLHFSMDGEGV